MGNLKKYGIVLLLLIGAFGAGRYLAPSKVEENTKKGNSQETVTVVREIVRPDGTKERETRTENRSETISERNIKVENNKTQYKVSALIGRNLDNNKDIYGAMVEKRLFANSMVGVWGTTDKQVGLSLSIEF